MAEFKLGRIRFVWKGNWAATTTYYIDDVVRYGGKTYICTVGHTSAADFNTDLEYSPTKWNQMSDGTEWKGNWTTGTFYKLNDVVKYGGLVYVCIDSHTSAATAALGLEADQAKWDLFAEGFDWREDWQILTRYKKNDLVRYGGYTYVCNEGHTSAATVTLGLEVDQSKWDDFNPGLEYKGSWATATRYKVNDVVKYGAGLWICTAHHTSNAFGSDSSNWSQFVEGFEFENNWNNSTTYQPGDVVRYGGNQYVSKTVHSAEVPTISTANWDLFNEGFKFQSDWVNTTSYKIGDVVRLNGYTYIATADSPSVVTTVTASTGLVPYTFTGNTSGMVVGMSIKFSGTTFGTVAPNATYYVKSIDSGNTFTISTMPGGTTFQPTTATGSMTATVAAMPTNASYWSVLTKGIQWRGVWADDTEYQIGDSVRYGSNAYICVLGHRSEGDDGSTIRAQGGGMANSRPDVDSSGTYWNVLAIGTETSVLTTRGDMVYYGGSGPTRLPIGIEGQILRSNGTDPEWVSLGKVDHVYYVAPHGVDGPAPIHGCTLDKPWKTIRYACEQIEKGCRNPNAQHLLELNRAFIQKEVTEWIQYQITNNLAPFTTSFDYDEYKCERDTGFLVDRLIWDIGHGGNLKIRAAAQAYIGALGEGPYSAEEEDMPYTRLSAEADEDIAAFEYMLSVVEAVLNNESPEVNYQVLNGDNSTAVVSQYINLDYTAEPGIMTTITSLVNIVITALRDKNSNNLPDRLTPNNTVNVKSGRYRETLPIIVPAETCILGDEVRSTNAGPAGSLVSPDDAKYSIGALGRLETVVGQVILGSNVTESTGNTESQNIAFPFASSVEETDIKRLVRMMQQRIDFRLNTMALATYPDPTGYNTSYLAGYGDARKLIRENKKFFQEQVKAWITENYPTLKYSRTACMRDVGYIIDAIVYDLTYGGNALSVQAGLAYYEGTGSALFINSSEKPATLAAYEYLKTIVQEVATNTVVTSNQSVITQFRDTALTGGSAATTFIGNNFNEMIDIVNNGPAAATLSDPSTGWVSGALTTAYTTLNAAASTIASNTITWINSNYPSLSYDSAKCSRDVQTILKAVGYDFMFNSNFQTLKAAHSYLRATATEVFSLNQKDATRSALEYVRTQAIANVGGDSTAIARINASMQIIDDVLFSATDEGSICQTEARSADWARLQLERNRNYIVSEISAWIGQTYKTTGTGTAGTTNLITVADTSWLQRNAAIRFSQSIGGIVAGTTYYVQNVVSSTTFRISTTRNSNTPVTLSTASGSFTVSLYYNSDLCLRDVNTYIDALKFDLMYPGNYKSRLAARYYVNAVLGSLEEDMYYVRNGTGIRNQTLDGLSGDLTPANAYGTSRVTAGAYVSLDPGWGPDDFRTWIIHRSPYVQNVTTFGYAAIGQKIDGALHAGGNDSIVSNDFTQVISDGIGAWVTNNGRAELVSVFTYYSHIGYLAEAGGRIRGTNGNNSYGDFGSVAEGFDVTETPGTGVVDNRNFKAAVGFVYTDSADDIYRFEFDNAGSEYTEATWIISGSGLNVSAEQDEFRDDAVFQVRLLDNVDDSTEAPESDGNFGGFGYVSNANTAQGGTTTQITIAATDQEISSAYTGMKIYLTGGTGVGQFGIITSFNSGTKVATVVRETTGAAGWDHVVPGTTIVSPDASTTYVIEPRVSFTAPGFTATASTLPTSGDWRVVKYGDTAAVYTGLTGTTSGAGTGATWQVIRNGSKYFASVVSSGIGYTRLDTVTISGTDLGGASTTNDLVITITAVNSVTGAIQAFETSGYGVGGLYIAVRDSSQVGATSVDGINWTTRATLMPASRAWKSIASGLLDDGSSVGKVSAFVAVAGGSTSSAAYSADGITWTTTSIVTSANWNSVTFGEGRFVAIASDSTTVRISQDGQIWDITGTLPATGYTSVTYGRGLFVAVRSGSSDAVYSTDGVTWTAVSLPASQAWNSVTWGNGRFVAVAGTAGTTAAYSIDGITWAASTVPSATYSFVTYGQGVFLAVSTSTVAATSENGVNWTSRTTSTAPSGFSAATFGNPNRLGRFVAVGGGTGTVGMYIRTGATARARAYVAEEKIFSIKIVEPGSGYNSTPTMTITDPNNIYDAPFTVRVGKGALANPSFKNRGTGYVSATAEVDTGDGYGDYFQSGQYIAMKRLTKVPVAGSNVVFGHLPGQTFKLVNVLTLLGTYPGDYRAFFQIAPVMKEFNSPNHEETVTTRIRYSQVRLTGHDFLDIGTGNFDETNYPNGTPENAPNQANETVDNNGGRVFYTSTDQDGNFRVGELFTIEQSTGVATLNADAFNIAGLQELTLGEVSLGGGSASITEFSTDPFFTANSDSIVPTQRAIKAYISSQIGGGGASLNVNSVTAGFIYIAGQQITTTTGGTIQMKATFEFQGGVTGLPVAWNYFLY